MVYISGEQFNRNSARAKMLGKKVTYQGAVQVNTEEAKNRCECSIDDLGINEFTKENVEVYPIPFKQN